MNNYPTNPSGQYPGTEPAPPCCGTSGSGAQTQAGVLYLDASEFTPTRVLSFAEGQFAVIQVSGHNDGVAGVLVVPRGRQYLIVNLTTGTFTLTISAGGILNAAVPQGTTSDVWSDSSGNVRSA